MKSYTCSYLKPCGVEKPWSTLSDKWFKWGQLYSFCKQYDTATKGINSTFDHGCTTIICKQCISVACNETIDPKSLTDCEEKCEFAECKVGCRFYAHIFNEYKGNFSVDYSNQPTARYSIVEDVKGMKNVKFSWDPFYSHGSIQLTSVYLITIHVNSIDKYEHALGLTQNTHITVSMYDICKDMFSRYKYRRTTKIAIKVYPTNFNGPTSIKESKAMNLSIQSEYTSPIEASPVENITIGLPVFQKEMSIIWDITWLDSSDIRSKNKGVNYFYKIKSCSNAEHFQKVKRQKHEYETTLSMFQLKLNNTKYDELETCSIEVDIRSKYGGCFLGSPFYKIIKYPGCKNVINYTSICPPPSYTFIREVYLRATGHTCENQTAQVCGVTNNFYKDLSCTCCYKPKYNISVLWKPFNGSHEVYNYMLRWGTFVGSFIRPMGEKSIRVPANTTSFVITSNSINAYPYVFGIQVYAETNISRTDWKWTKNTAVTLKLKHPDPECISATSPMSALFTIIIPLLILLLISIVVTLMSYRYFKTRRQRKKFSTMDEEVCMEPKRTISADDWEVYPSYITVDEKIGAGAFGTVYRATIETSILVNSQYVKQCGGVDLMNDNMIIAVKFLKEGAEDMEYEDFEEEISLMKCIGYHKNIVNMVGCSTIKPPLCLIVEYMQHGDLLNYMRKHRIKGVNNTSDHCNAMLSPQIMMSFAWQIACGMEYLATNNIVHRDLAARNILVGSANNIKISDFGLSRHVSNELIYVSKNKVRKLPLKWMSTEAIYLQTFTTASDVWAYGVVLFEIVTLGGTPYPTIDNRELGKMLNTGYRMEMPDNCDVEMYDIMLHCWNKTPSERPTFTELREHIEKTVEHEHYFNFEFDESKIYYNTASFRSVQPEDKEEEDDHLTKDCNEKQIDFMDDTFKNKHKSGSLNDENKIERYYSPLKLFSVPCTSFDNPNLTNGVR